jgi:hypothetical protein
MPTFSAGNRLTANDLMRLPQTLARVRNAGAGTQSTGTTDTADAVLGTVSVVADGVSFYRIAVENLTAAAVTGGTDPAAFRIRDGGASAPTSASTEIAIAPWKPQGTGGTFQEAVALGATVQLSAGTHTFGLFSQRTSGATTNFQPVGDRSLVVALDGDV